MCEYKTKFISVGFIANTAQLWCKFFIKHFSTFRQQTVYQTIDKDENRQQIGFLLTKSYIKCDVCKTLLYLRVFHPNWTNGKTTLIHEKDYCLTKGNMYSKCSFCFCCYGHVLDQRAGYARVNMNI